MNGNFPCANIFARFLCVYFSNNYLSPSPPLNAGFVFCMQLVNPREKQQQKKIFFSALCCPESYCCAHKNIKVKYESGAVLSSSESDFNAHYSVEAGRVYISTHAMDTDEWTLARLYERIENLLRGH